MPIPRPLVKAVGRLKPAIPSRAWPLLNTAASFVGTGPLVGLPAFRRVLAIAAHPDDESIGCGGVLALLARSGAEAHLAFATDGEATWATGLDEPEIAARRRKEAIESCRILGLPAPDFFGLPDGGLVDRAEELGQCIERLVAARDPEVVMVPWFLDGHPDHQAVSRALEHARIPEKTEIWGYETWTALPANRLVDVSRVMDLKEASMRSHLTALQTFDVTAAQGLNRWRSIHGLHGKGYGEAFLALPVQEYLALSRRVRDL
ncbi:MAG: hypothetical protein JWM62_3268 [Frankiales bacterium]|jgi:LmbE family N-acetylglucosaminyl deacetylase|nr:hypothetical protein [Frankiales bacterium]